MSIYRLALLAERIRSDMEDAAGSAALYGMEPFYDLAGNPDDPIEDIARGLLREHGIATQILNHWNQVRFSRRPE